MSYRCGAYVINSGSVNNSDTTDKIRYCSDFKNALEHFLKTYVTISNNILHRLI